MGHTYIPPSAGLRPQLPAYLEVYVRIRVKVRVRVRVVL